VVSTDGRTAAPLLDVRGLTRRFGAVKAVDDVSFALDGGTIMGFVGPNGAGKTTTMRILATLDEPTSGQVFLDGCSVVDDPDTVRPWIGYMPDRIGSYDDMTVSDFLDFFARAYGLDAATRRQRMAEVMEFTGLGPLGAKLMPSLSKGMRQRAALGRTLLHDPRLLVLDEPADGLDPRSRIELRQMLRALAARKKAILVSSHILTELSEICDSCAIIEQGRLLAVGPVQAVAARAAGSPAAEIAVRMAAVPAAPLLAQAERLLLAEPSVATAFVSGDELRVRLAQPDAAAEAAASLDGRAAQLLRVLTGAGLPVCTFQYRRADLEDAFMNITRGKVS
jgi:ABC-2 type transport system ATP-binding protein